MSKYWRPVTVNDVEMMTIGEIQDAVAISGFPKEVSEWIWEKKRSPFEVF